MTLPAASIDIRFFDNGMLESLTSPWKLDSQSKNLVEGLTADQIQFKAEYPLPIPRTVRMDPYSEMDPNHVLMIITRAFAFGWVDATGAATISNWKWKATGYTKFFSAPTFLEDHVPLNELATRQARQDARSPAKNKVSVLKGRV